MNVEKLDLRGNGLKALPESLKKLTNIKKLELYENEFDALPEWIGLFLSFPFLVSFLFLSFPFLSSMFSSFL